MCLPVSVFVGHTDVLSVFLLKSLEGCISSVSCNQTELINGFLWGPLFIERGIICLEQMTCMPDALHVRHGNKGAAAWHCMMCKHLLRQGSMQRQILSGMLSEEGHIFDIYIHYLCSVLWNEKHFSKSNFKLKIDARETFERGNNFKSSNDVSQLMFLSVNPYEISSNTAHGFILKMILDNGP